MELSLALSHALSSPAASRFGHTCSLIHAHDSAWVVELAVVLFGVKRRNEGDLDEQPSDEVYTATNSISVLDLDGRSIWLFGGHYIQHDTGKKKRVFFDELWSLCTDAWTFSLEWSHLKGPSKRDMATLTSVGGGKLILFGGRGENGRALADLWSFDVHTKAWTQLKPPLPYPAPRKLHAAVSIGCGRLLLYGGERDLGGSFDELWTLRGLDMEESTPIRWTPIKLRPSPGGRFGHTLSYLSSPAPPGLDANEADQAFVLLFGGSLNQVDAWCISLSSFKWSKVDIGSRSMQPRLCHTIVSLSPLPTSSLVDKDDVKPSFRLLLLGGRGTQGVVGGEEASWFIHATPTALSPKEAEEPSAISTVFGSASTPVNLFRSLIGFTAPLVNAPASKPSTNLASMQPPDSSPDSNHRPRLTNDEILAPLEAEEEVPGAPKDAPDDILREIRSRIGLAGDNLLKPSPPLSCLGGSLDPHKFMLGSVSFLLEQVQLNRDSIRKEMAKTLAAKADWSVSSFRQAIDQMSHGPLPTALYVTMGQIQELLKEIIS